MMAIMSSAMIILLSILFLSDGQLILTTTPKIIETDLTKSLLVNCSFYEPVNGDMIVSLIIKKETGSGNDSLIQLAYINTYTYSIVHSVGHLNATCLGQINIQHSSYLGLQWEYPSISESGKYVCDANIMDSFGEVRLESVHAFVEMNAPEITQIVQRIQEIETSLKDTKNIIDSLVSLQSQMLHEVSALQSVQSDWKTALFSTSQPYVDQYESSHYYLSRYRSENANDAEAACIATGGYLAEVDNKHEYTFIINFTKPLVALIGSLNILLSGMSDRNGTWINRRNGTLLGYTEWSPYEYADSLSNGTESSLCQAISLRYSMSAYMHQIQCFNTGISSPYFLCELNHRL